MDNGLGRTSRITNLGTIVLDETALDEAYLYLRDLLIARVRVAHRGRRCGELARLDRLIDEVMMGIHELYMALYGTAETN